MEDLLNTKNSSGKNTKNVVEKPTFSIAFADSQQIENSAVYTQFIQNFEPVLDSQKMTIQGAQAQLRINEEENIENSKLGIIVKYLEHSSILSKIYNLQNSEKFLEYTEKNHKTTIFDKIKENTLEAGATEFEFFEGQSFILTKIQDRRYYFTALNSQNFDAKKSVPFTKIGENGNLLENFLKDYILVGGFENVTKKLVEYQLMGLIKPFNDQSDHKQAFLFIQNIMAELKNEATPWKNTQKIQLESMTQDFQQEHVLHLPEYKKDSGFFSDKNYQKFPIAEQNQKL